MPRLVPKPLTLEDDEQQELEKILTRHSTSHRYTACPEHGAGLVPRTRSWVNRSVLWINPEHGAGQASFAALTLKGTPSDKDTAPRRAASPLGHAPKVVLKDTAAPSGRADPSGRASQAQAHMLKHTASHIL